MSTIYTSNRLENLCQTLAENLRKPEHGVFWKDIIITQTAGMNAWLKTEIAERNGVFANFEFQNQDGFFAGVYKLLFGERLTNNVDAIKYKIFGFLSSEAFIREFGKVAGYYENNDLRRFQLATRIADLFDQYQLYRPEMIENWEKGLFSTENSAEKWQCWLWLMLDVESRSGIKLKVVDQLEVQKDLIARTYPEISLFGISVYTRFHLDFFKALAKYTRVNFYLCLPTQHKEFRNELLVSFGAKAGELSRMFGFQDFLAEENTSDTLLSRIQSQVIHNKTNPEWKDDESVQINSCFTPVREVECLYNYLLDLFDKDRSLNPKDVLVMTTDINKYAPFVKAVFNNAPVNIPVQVSGVTNTSDNTVVASLEQILCFTEEDMTSEKVISLLEQKRIKQRFGIQDCNYIRSVVRKANIRFGRKNRTEDDTQYVSWKYGLEKILLGYAMLTDEEFAVSGDITLYPYKDTEGSGSYELLRLKGFVEELEAVVDTFKESKTLADWKLFLFEDVIEKMVYHDDFDQNDRAELTSINKALSFIAKLELPEEVPFPVFLDELKSKLFSETSDSKLNTGRVTVSSPIPVRGIPFKIICFLGLNNDIFPGKDRFLGFDLLGDDYQEGDRNKKETDKYLFLDTLLAAREKLYLSYIGQSVKDNTEIPPSIVVDTLLDYLDRDAILIKHPLHGFSSRYQADDKRLFTYLGAVNASEFKPKEPEQTELTEVSVYSFVKFFEHPVEWYFNTILGIKHEENDDTLPETELFKLDHLQKWMIKNELIRLREEELDLYLSKGIKEGRLPLKNLGKVIFDELVEDTAAIRNTYFSLIKSKEEKNIVIDLTIENIRFTGTIDSVYGNEFIAYTFSDNLKYRVRAHINMLLLCATDSIESAVFLSENGVASTLVVLPTDAAKVKLKELLAYFRKGAQSPLKFTLESSDLVNHKSKVENIFKKEALGDSNASIPPNLYMAKLFDEGYFKEFDVEKFNPAQFDVTIYDDMKYDEIKAIAALLNLKNNGL
jgi:exodeoxyribonuclease V gamma subunit